MEGKFVITVIRVSKIKMGGSGRWKSGTRNSETKIMKRVMRARFLEKD
jgi:hypothetical protein